MVPDSHAFAAWQLRNGSWAGFRIKVPGTKSFSVGMISASEDNGRSVGGTWRYPDNNDVPFRFGPENPQVASSADERWFYSVYDALEQAPQGPTTAAPTDQDERAGAGDGAGLCTDKTKCDSIGIAWSADGFSWPANASTTLRVQGLHGDDNHPCGQIRTALGLVAEPMLCSGCYSVLWTGFSNKSSPCSGAVVLGGLSRSVRPLSAT